MRRVTARGWCLVLAALVLLAPVVAAAQSPAPNAKPAAPKLDVEFEPTPQHIVEAMLKLARVTAADTVTDLGCGEGRIPITAVKQFSAKGIGVDLDPLRIREANANAEKQGVAGRVTFIEGDLFKADISASTVVTLFLWPSINLKLRPKLLELAPGTRIVSHAHNMGDWPADRVEWHTAPDGRSAIYLWIVPSKVGGTWSLEAEGETHEVRLAQSFQHFTGAGTAKAGASPRIRNGRIHGDTITFELITPKFKVTKLAGRITGDAIASEGAAVEAPPAAHAKAPFPSAPFRMQRKP